MPATHYLANALLNEVFRGVNYVPPPTAYIALFSTPTDDLGGGTELTAVTAPGYARAALTSANMSPPTSKRTQNVTVVAFATATGDWPMVTHYAVYDAPTGGNMLHHHPLTEQELIEAGQTPRFGIGQLTFTL